MVHPPLVAYFSMEIGLESGMPTYSGGLGVLAGDTIRSAADLEVPMAAERLREERGPDSPVTRYRQALTWTVRPSMSTVTRSSISSAKSLTGQATGSSL